MSDFFSSGLAVDVVLGVIVLEFIGLCAWRGLRQALSIGPALLPGVFLLLALRAALTGAEWPWIAGALAASFPVHLLDLWRRMGGK